MVTPTSEKVSQSVTTIVNTQITIIQIKNRRLVLAPTGVPKSGIVSATSSSAEFIPTFQKYSPNVCALPFNFSCVATAFNIPSF